MPSNPVAHVTITWRGADGDLWLSVESWADDGDRWHLSKHRYAGVVDPYEVAALIREHLTSGDFT